MAGGSGGGHGATAGVWAAVVLIIAGSIVSGIALIEWIWWMFYAGVGLMVGGGLLAFFAGIMDSVSEFTLPPGREAARSSS
jgi:hypothetical protein